jgi:hypothetical protein
VEENLRWRTEMIRCECKKRGHGGPGGRCNGAAVYVIERDIRLPMVGTIWRTQRLCVCDICAYSSDRRLASICVDEVED